MERQATFNIISTLWACDDISHTGQAYSIVEQLSANTVVIMVLEFAPHFELESVFGTLFLAAIFTLVFAM